jgi:phosphoribosylglycinamide formyltransferase-1
MFDEIRRSGATLVVMGGYLEHLLIPDDFYNRVINIHPSLIPAFCGKGMYGLHVHKAAIEFGVKVSGCTVHYVDNQYDHGPILLQRSCEVLETDTAESLQKRVFELECQVLPEAIAAIARRSSE